jgi:pimeloyl-ACP methyl ester carboxylesterase
MPISFPAIPRPSGARKKSFAEKQKKSEKGPVSHGYVKSFDGTKLFYSMEGKGRPLIFCYGLVCSSLHWTYQIEHFQSTHQAIWFDYRGHQNSEVPSNLSSLTLENIAKDLGTVLDELNIQDAVLLGHSMGVNVVLEFYRQQPHRVAGMVLANGTAQRPLETSLGHNMIHFGMQVLKKLNQKSPSLVNMLWKSQKSNPLARTLVALGGFNPHLTPQADIDLYINQVLNTDPAILIHLIENYEAYDATSWLHTIQAPTLILAGEHDKMIPVERQELMYQLIPKSQLEIIRHGSHCPQMDLPELVNLKIEKFLNSINYGPIANPTKESANLSSETHLDPGPVKLS